MFVDAVIALGYHVHVNVYNLNGFTNDGLCMSYKLQNKVIVVECIDETAGCGNVLIEYIIQTL